MTMASTYIARVRKGRLVLDEPTDLPEGLEIELVPAKGTAATERTARLVEAAERVMEAHAETFEKLAK